MFRCSACKGILADPSGKRCEHCGTSLRRRPPVILAEERAGTKGVAPLERRRIEAKAKAELEAQQPQKRRRRRKVEAEIPEVGTAIIAEAFVRADAPPVPPEPRRIIVPPHLRAPQQPRQEPQAAPPTPEPRPAPLLAAPVGPVRFEPGLDAAEPTPVKAAAERTASGLPRRSAPRHDHDGDGAVPPAGDPSTEAAWAALARLARASGND